MLAESICTVMMPLSSVLRLAALVGLARPSQPNQVLHDSDSVRLQPRL